MSYIMYADIESLIQKIDGRANNPEKYSTTKIGKDIPCTYSTSTIRVFDHLIILKTSMLYFLRNIVWKRFCSSLKEHATNIFNFERKKMLPLTKEVLKVRQETAIVTVVEKES